MASSNRRQLRMSSRVITYWPDDAPRLPNAQERRGLGELGFLEAGHVLDQVPLDVVDLPAGFDLAGGQAARVGAVHALDAVMFTQTSPARSPVMRIVRSVGMDSPACRAFAMSFRSPTTMNWWFWPKYSAGMKSAR